MNSKKRQKWTESLMNAAVEAIIKEMGYEKASKQFKYK